MVRALLAFSAPFIQSPALPYSIALYSIDTLLPPRQAIGAHLPHQVIPPPCSCQLYERFRPGQKPPPELGPSRDYNVDLVPKFIMVRASSGAAYDKLCEDCCVECVDMEGASS